MSTNGNDSIFGGIVAKRLIDLEKFVCGLISRKKLSVAAGSFRTGFSRVRKTTIRRRWRAHVTKL